MNNYITIYVTSQLLFEALIDYVDDISSKDFEIELDKDEVEIHISKRADKADLPPENMSGFIFKFTSLVKSEKIQLSDDILYDIKELSWSSALWDNDTIIENSEFEYTCSGKQLERVVLPEGIEVVESSSFALAKRLKEIVTPDKFVKWGCMAIDDDSPLYNYYGYDKEDPATALRYMNKNLIGYVACAKGSTVFNVFKLGFSA